MKKSILIVDDEPEIVELLTEFVKQIGHSALSASNGLQGLEVATSQNPDLIISDINMPKMNGLEMLEKFKSTGSKTPVILFTAFSDTQKIKAAWKLGAFDFVEKPIDFAALQKIIDKAIEFGSLDLKNKTFSKPVEITLTLPADLHEKLNQLAKEQNLGLNDFLISKLSI